MNTALRVVVGGLLGGLLMMLNGCAFSISDLDQLAPKPSGVTVKEPPDITDADVELTIIDQQDYGYWDVTCDWVCYWWCCPCWDCWDIWIWTRTDVTCNIKIKLDVKDPSLDLNEHPSWVRVMDAEMPSTIPGGRNRQKICLLNIDQRDIALKKTDITGTDVNKIVRVQLKNVRTSLTPDCLTRAAELPLRLLVNDQGVEVISPTEGRVTVIIEKK
jgi:hypothetical protein